MILLEREWLACGEPEKMLAFLEGKASKRKIYLFRHASVRRLWPLLTADERRQMQTNRDEMAETVSGPANRVDLLLPLIPFWGGRAELLKPFNGESERWARAKLLRDLFGPLPFRPVTIDPALLAWNDGLVVRLAQAAYEERHLPEGTLDSGRLAVLADALEEAGCTNADILGHLRGPGPHVRGCWVVDLLLGKE
jgi:hypothetical protein